MNPAEKTLQPESLKGANYAIADASPFKLAWRYSHQLQNRCLTYKGVSFEALLNIAARHARRSKTVIA
jgi:hypothetical protein